MPKIVGELVWVKGMRGPTVEKWPIDNSKKDVAPAARKVVLARHPLNEDEYRLSLLILEQRYPLP